MAIEIVPMTERDIPEAVECVQTAFAEDPYFQWLFDNTKVSPVAENNAQALQHPHGSIVWCKSNTQDTHVKSVTV